MPPSALYMFVLIGIGLFRFVELPELHPTIQWVGTVFSGYFSDSNSTHDSDEVEVFREADDGPEKTDHLL